MTVSGIAVKSSVAKEGEHGVEVESPPGRAGASWVATEQDARVEFEARLASFASQTTGEEKLYRVKLVIGGNLADTQLAAVGEVTPSPALLDALSLTYLGVLATIALTAALNADGLGVVPRVLLGVGVFLGLGLLLSARPVRRFVLRSAHGALGGPDDRQR